MKDKEHYNLTDSFDTYQKISKTNTLPQREYLIIVKQFMKFISSELISKGSVLLPERLGKINVIGKKKVPRIEEGKLKGLFPDWGETKKLWARDEESRINKQLVYHFNEETNGVSYKFVWEKGRVLVENKTLYDVKLTRENTRSLSKAIQEGNEYLIKS